MPRRMITGHVDAALAGAHKRKPKRKPRGMRPVQARPEQLP